MVAELWIVKMGSQVSTNLKQALHQPSKKTNNNNKNPNSQIDAIDAKNQRIGILSFEVANVMSKTVYLYKSLTDSEISKLKSEISTSEGIKNLVSSDQNYLLELVLAEKLDDLNRVASVVARLGKRCSEPALQGFEHVYGDIVSGVIDVRELGFLVKDMDAMVRRLERYVNSTSNLFGEMEVLNELEQATKKFQNNQHEESKRAFEQKLSWQRQDVRQLREVSLWNQSYDKVVELLARTVCTVFARIVSVFGEPESTKKEEPLPLKRCLSKASACSSNNNNNHSSSLKRGSSFRPNSRRPESGGGDFRPEDMVFPCGTGPGKLFMECLSLSTTALADEDEEDRASRVSARTTTTTDRGSRREERGFSGAKIRTVCRAPPATVGGSALALHYANVVVVIEKLLRYPHLVGEEARDDLYRMLPESLRSALRASLRPCARTLAIYDAPLAHGWKEALDGVLTWLAPLAHGTMRWQSERSFEQQAPGVGPARTNVLLVQTLHFADRGHTEAAICRLLVGLNYICRYEQQQNALLDCASSFDFDDCLEWQLQCRASSCVD